MGRSGRIRVMVVDDSALMRRVICSLLEEDPEIEVAGTAVDGLDAISKLQTLKPDVITLDVEMPRLDGLQTLGYLMSEHPVPCVMLSAYTPRGADITLKALDYGATDFVQKPSGAISLNLERVKDELLSKVKVARGIDLSRLPFKPGQAAAALPAPAKPRPPLIKSRPSLAAIGTSTGGPRALAAVLPLLPADYPAPIVIVQHMSAGFTSSLAQRLNKESRIQVKEAVDGEHLEAGTAYLAPGDWHVQVMVAPGGAVIKLDQRPPVLGVRPSADILFASVAEAFGPRALGIVLTGMGRDGCKGLKAMKAKNARTLAQDEETCVVYGMPRAAVAAGVIDQVVPLSMMAQAMLENLP